MFALRLKSVFEHAGKEDPSLTAKPALAVDRLVFDQIFSPVKTMLENDPVYAPYETGTAFQIGETITLLQAAWSKEVNPEKSEARNAMRNALQGIQERLEDFNSLFVHIDMDELLAIVKYADALDDAAHIHGAFMGNRAQAQSLAAVAEGIRAAQNRYWIPATDYQFDITAEAAND